MVRNDIFYFVLNIHAFQTSVLHLLLYIEYILHLMWDLIK